MVDLEYLLNQEESEWLDFKQEWHKENGNLLHDILSMLNSKSNQKERFIIIGVRDNKEVIGVKKSDKKRKSEHNLNNLIQDSFFNILPFVTVIRHKYKGFNIDIISVKPMNPPYYLTRNYQWAKNRKKYTEKGAKPYVLSAGAVYSRVGSNNTPLNTTTNESEIIDLWKRRFGLDISPLERLKIYLKDHKNWEVVLEGFSQRIHYKPFPEFTIYQSHRDIEDFEETWANKFPNPNASSYIYYLKYHGTILSEEIIVACDGGRYSICLPDRVFLVENNGSVVEYGIGMDESNVKTFYYKLRSDISYNLDFIVSNSANRFYQYTNELKNSIFIFNTKEEAKEYFIRNFNNEK